MTSQNFFDVTTEEELAIRYSFSRSNEDIAADVAVLKEWLKKQPHLPQDHDEHFIRNMLQRNKFSLEKTKSKFDIYFSIRNLIPEFYEDRDMLGGKMQNIMNQVIVVPLPKLTNNLARVILIKFTKADSELFDIHSYLKYSFALQDLRLYKDPSDSEIFLLDCQNMKLGHVVKFNPVLLKKAMTVFLKAYSDRLKGVYFINMQSYVNSLVTHTVIVEKKTIRQVDWKKRIEAQRDWLLKQAELKSNEDLRIEGSLNEDIFGSIHGSFRKLNDLRLYKDPSDSEIFLLDCQNMKLGHVVKFNPVVVKKAMTVFLKAYSDRLKGVYFINMQPYVNSLVTLTQSLLKDKLAARVQAHKNLESLHKVISKDCLPSDYEGDEKSLSELFVDWKKHIEGKRDWLLKQAELKSNEDLRIGGSINEDIFGSIHGSFRTLNVD